MVRVLSIAAGLQVPGIVLVETDGRAGAVSPSQRGPIVLKVGITFSCMETVVEQVMVLPHSSVAVHVMVLFPGLKLPLASALLPLRLVAPVIKKETVTLPPQFSAVADGTGIR